MGEIRVQEGEIEFLKDKIQAKRATSENKEDIKWNSSLATYEPLVIEIKKSFGDKGVPATFLRNFFYKPRTKQVREGSIDRLYKFLFDMTRNEYLTANRLSFEEREHVLYTSEQLKEANNSIQLKDFDVLATLEEHSTADVLGLLENGVEITLYIDELFLKDIQGVELLIELFCFRYIQMVVDYNVNFKIERSLENIASDFSLKSYHGWSNTQNYWKENEAKTILLSHEICDKIQGKDFLVILSQLIRFSVIGFHKTKNLISEYLPICNKINDSSIVQPLRNIYAEGRKGEYYCVIGYDAYFNKSDKREMLKYFAQFSVKLNGNKVYRIFTIPAKRAPNKKWSSILHSSINQLLYQYMYLNMKGGIQTLAHFYDPDDSRRKENILYDQDYVIYNDATIKNFAHSSRELFELKGQLGKDAKLFFAYPEDKFGENQCIQFNDKFYIARLLKDFSARMNVEEKSDYLLNFDSSETSRKAITNMLNLSYASGNHAYLEEEADTYRNND